MLQSMFYVLGIYFFCITNVFTTMYFYTQVRTEVNNKKKEALRAEIMDLLERVADMNTRERASTVFSKAKTVEALQEIKSRLVTIIVTGEK